MPIKVAKSKTNKRVQRVKKSKKTKKSNKNYKKNSKRVHQKGGAQRNAQSQGPQRNAQRQGPNISSNPYIGRAPATLPRKSSTVTRKPLQNSSLHMPVLNLRLYNNDTSDTSEYVDPTAENVYGPLESTKNREYLEPVPMRVSETSYSSGSQGSVSSQGSVYQQPLANDPKSEYYIDPITGYKIPMNTR